jgi:hypothetical protein
MMHMYRITFPGTGLNPMTGTAEALALSLENGLALCPDIWARAVFEQQTMNTEYSGWSDAACNLNEWRHLGPWTHVAGTSSIERCGACGSESGK